MLSHFLYTFHTIWVRAQPYVTLCSIKMLVDVKTYHLYSNIDENITIKFTYLQSANEYAYACLR